MTKHEPETTAMPQPTLSEMLLEIGAELGVLVELEPQYGVVGELVFKNGRRHFFRGPYFLNVNRAGAVDIAKDKDSTKFFLRKHGFNVPRGLAFLSETWNGPVAPRKRHSVEDAVRFADKIGYPVYCKPNDLSEGRHVAKARTTEQVQTSAQHIFDSGKTDVALVEEEVPGNDYRVVVFGHKVVCAFQRIPLEVTGDGTSTIAELLEQKRSLWPKMGRPSSQIQPSDRRIRDVLLSQGMSAATVLETGVVTRLLDNANLSTGGTAVDVSDGIHSDFADLSIRASGCLGLRLCGVDIICEDLMKPLLNQAYSIIELNGAPGLDDYAVMGQSQYGRVRDLYTEVFRYLSGASI